MSSLNPLLPVIQKRRKPFFDWKNRLAVAVRIFMLLLIVIGIRWRETANNDSPSERPVLSIKVAQYVVPNAETVEQQGEDLQAAFGSDEQPLGSVTSTIPEANGVIGYRGPSHSVLLVDEAGIIQKAALLSSRDTPEHIQIVKDDKAFWKQFEGWQPGSLKSPSEIDAVSGATLTSLAVAEGIALRMGQRPGSMKFPDAISLEELSTMWPEPRVHLEASDEDTHVEVVDAEGRTTGLLIRTGALIDSIAGYQGPTELLIAVDSVGRIIDVRKRSSWDNEPYASYMDDEPGFWKAFRGASLEDIAEANLEELEVEGVSGATMTSVAAADTVIAAAAEWVQRRQQEQAAKEAKQIHWTANDVGSVLVVLVGCLIALTRLRSIRWLSLVWNIVLVVYFGLLTGNLISLVLIFGWSASGIAYQLAPGLTVVVAASFMLPALSKRNVYCSHLCPHGAAQQLLRNRLPKRLRLPRRWMKILTWVPGILLLAATISVIVNASFNLAAIEPFNAYIWYVSGMSSLVLAVTSLIWSSFEPMAWCRYGCSTGRLLDYVRLTAASTRFRIADAVVLAMAGMSLAM